MQILWPRNSTYLESVQDKCLNIFWRECTQVVNFFGALKTRQNCNKYMSVSDNIVKSWKIVKQFLKNEIGKFSSNDSKTNWLYDSSHSYDYKIWTMCFKTNKLKCVKATKSRQEPLDVDWKGVLLIVFSIFWVWTKYKIIFETVNI